MNVSVEISTFNRKETLRKLLKLLATQTYPSDLTEVVISDDGSTDGLTDMASSIAPELPYRLKLLSHEHRGPAHTHNRGIEAAESEIVIMLAADVLPSPALIAEHVKSHQEHPAAHVMVSGQLVQSAELPDTVLQRSWDRMLNRMFHEDEIYLTHKFFFVSNISFKKKFMQRYGMFLDWPAGSMEDIELGHRLKRNGMSLVRNTRALGYHYHPVRLETIANRAYTEGYYWHRMEEHAPEVWVRAKSGHLTPSDGWQRYLLGASRHLLKKYVVKILVVNDLTIRAIIVPIIKRAEKWHLLAPGMPLFIRLLSIYFHDKGREDFETGAGFDSAHTTL